MKRQAVPTISVATFVLRFWHETSAGEVRWRGCIEHVHSGMRVHFSDKNGLLDSLQRFSITMDPQVGGQIAVKPDNG